MYIRTTKRTYKEKEYTNNLLVESIWTPKGPRQKVVCSLGDLAPRSRGEWLKLVVRVEEALVGQGDLLAGEDEEVKAIVERVLEHRLSRSSQDKASSSDLVGVHTDQVSTERRREAGPVHVGLSSGNGLGWMRRFRLLV